MVCLLQTYLLDLMFMLPEGKNALRDPEPPHIYEQRLRTKTRIDFRCHTPVRVALVLRNNRCLMSTAPCNHHDTWVPHMSTSEQHELSHLLLARVGADDGRATAFRWNASTSTLPKSNAASMYDHRAMPPISTLDAPRKSARDMRACSQFFSSPRENVFVVFIVTFDFHSVKTSRYWKQHRLLQ